MNKEIGTLLGTSIVPRVIDLIVENEQADEMQAIEKFYESKTYGALSDAETGVWHLSPLAIYEIWKHENETGEVIFPEEQ